MIVETGGSVMNLQHLRYFVVELARMQHYVAEVIRSVIQDLAKDGVTMVVVTHEMSLARKVGTRISPLFSQRRSSPAGRTCSSANGW